MSALVWDQIGQRFFETGVKKGVLYPFKKAAGDTEAKYQNGVAWNGLTSVSENPEGGEANPQWADDIKYLNLVSAEDFKATIEAFTYPEEFAECDGSATPTTGMRIGQQKRIPFGFSYVTTIGNDEDGLDHGYKIHLVYGAQAAPSERSHETVNEDPEAMTFSWEISTTPVAMAGYKPTAHIEIDSTKFTTVEQKGYLKALEDYIYGTDGNSATDAKLPTPDQVKLLLTTGSATE